MVDGCTVEDVSFVAGRPPDNRDVTVKVRYRATPVAARIEPSIDDTWDVRSPSRREASPLARRRSGTQERKS